MNALNRNLKVGERLVMKTGQHVEIISHTFGCSSFTMGTAIRVKLIGEPDQCGFQVEGCDIDRQTALASYGSQWWSQQ